MSSPDGQGAVKAAGQSARLSWQEPRPGWLAASVLEAMGPKTVGVLLCCRLVPMASR